MIRNAINYVQALRTAPPSPLGVLLGGVMVAVGLRAITRYASHKQAIIAGAAGELDELERMIVDRAGRLREIKAEIGAALNAAEVNAAEGRDETAKYPTERDLRPLVEHDLVDGTSA